MCLKSLIILWVLCAHLNVQALTLTIPSYPVESVIPNDYTFSSGGQCSGENVSPQLVWGDIPDGTQSFAVVFIDENFNWLHWKLYNIDASVNHIPENNPNNVGIDGQSSFGINAYGGPCPPSNTPGNYVFTVHALNTIFANEPSVAAIQAATIESASWLAFRAKNDDQERYEYMAKYKLTFHAEWSMVSHPVDFPNGAHFSPLYGNTHKSGGSIWQQAALASGGIEQMAETGSTSLLSNEIIALMNNYGAESLVSGSGSSGTDITELEFEISETHPLFSMVSMIAPSPDWFIGVHDLDLRENGLWKSTHSVDLLPYDSGTDDGITFGSSNSNTNPPELIQQIVSTPFANAVPLGRFVFDLISTAGVPTPDNIFSNGFE